MEQNGGDGHHPSQQQPQHQEHVPQTQYGYVEGYQYHMEQQWEELHGHQGWGNQGQHIQGYQPGYG
jgi:hypothetical protein